jgi:PAS domain S-box-containing protein
MIMRTQWKELKPIITSAGYQGTEYITILDEEGTILLADARMQKELNLKSPRQVRNNFFDLLHPLHIEAFKNAFQHSMKYNTPSSMELYLKNGAYHLMKWQVSSLPGKTDGLKTFMCLGAFTDIPSGEHLPAGNEKAEKIFKAFMKNTPNLVWVVEEDGTLVYANHTFFQYFRLDETALNKKIAELLPLAVADALYERHLKVVQTGLHLEVIEKGRSADGTVATFRINLFLADDTPGKKLIAGIASDQSERKKVEKNWKWLMKDWYN